MEGGAWEATVHGVTKSRTQLSDFTFTFWVSKENLYDEVGYLIQHCRSESLI